MYLHRCLQHTKKNVKAEAAKKDEVSGQARLKRQEFLPVLVEWLEFS